MITEIITTINSYSIYINFIAHITIFFGTLFVAIYNTKLPHWHVTPLWYVGLASALVVISTILQWTIGAEYPLSYWNFGQVAEVLSNISLAAIAAIMLMSTVIRMRK